MKLTYRMHTEADINSLVHLWVEETGWDQITREIWEHRFVHTPFGKASIVLALDETDKLVGQLVFIPLIARINGREAKAYRPFAAYLTQEARRFQLINPLNHPMLKMYRLAADTFRQDGTELICMMPDPHFGRALQLVPDWISSKFPLWSINLPLSKKFTLPEEYEACEVTPDDERIDELWERSRDLYPCSVVKNSQLLKWRASHFNHRFTGIMKSGELVAFATARPKMRDKQWLICDILATDAAALEAVILASCNQADIYRIEHPEEMIEKAGILTTGLIQPIVERAGFFKDRYNFLLIVQLLNSQLKAQDIDPKGWNMSGSD